jgi:hypothetical protein
VWFVLSDILNTETNLPATMADDKCGLPNGLARLSYGKVAIKKTVKYFTIFLNSIE